MSIKPEKLFMFLEKIHDDFQPLAEIPQFDKWHAHHRAIITLYGSIFELVGSCITLINKQQIIGVPILLRSILEGYVDLVNLIQDPKYGYHLDASSLIGWIKLLDEAKVGNNEFVLGLTDISDEIITQLKSKNEELKKLGFKPLPIKDKFKQAAMLKEYQSIFNMLSWDSHNNLNSLINRHINQKDEDFSIVIYKATTPQDSAMHVALIIEFFMRATRLVHDFLKSPVQNKISEYRPMLDKLHIEAENLATVA